jgi:hypothetical protein
MTERVPAEQIEQVVGAPRHPFRHIARASAEQTVYVLHSQMCKDMTPDLRECPFSLALDNGINEYDWADMYDRPLRVMINEGQLVPVHNGGQC